MKKWLKKQEEISKTREKIKKWKDAKQNKETVVHIRKEQDMVNEKEKFINISETKKELENENDRKRNKVKLEEWKEMKQLKKRLEESSNIIKAFSSKPEKKHVHSIANVAIQMSTINSKPRSMSVNLNKPNTLHNTIKDVVKLNVLSFVQNETNLEIEKIRNLERDKIRNLELIKSYQERDLQIIKQRKERSKNKKRKSFEEIHPFRANARFNSSQFLTSSMIDLSSYNNSTQSSQAKITQLTNRNYNNLSNTNIQPDRRSSSLMQIEQVPRLRTPAWRTIS